MTLCKHLFKKYGDILFIFLFLVSCSGSKISCVGDVSVYDFKDGDIVFQHIPSYLCSVIADVTDSQYSHCGIVVLKNGQPYILEAIGPVRYTPIKTWINRGTNGQFTQLRPKGISKKQVMKAIREAEKLLGRPYDIQYELDEQKIYCSELVYKAFLRGCNIKIGKKETLGSLNWKPYEKFIRYIAHGELPLNRIMVTPESLARSSKLELIYSSFPPRYDEPIYSTSHLKGTWQGEYTIKGLNKAIATLKLNNNGELKSGYIKISDHKIVSIISFSVTPFIKERNFTANLTDDRRITAIIKAQIRDQGNKIIGTWEDNLGYTGVFSLGKIGSSTV